MPFLHCTNRVSLFPFKLLTTTCPKHSWGEKKKFAYKTAVLITQLLFGLSMLTLIWVCLGSLKRSQIPESGAFRSLPLPWNPFPAPARRFGKLMTGFQSPGTAGQLSPSPCLASDFVLTQTKQTHRVSFPTTLTS